MFTKFFLHVQHCGIVHEDEEEVWPSFIPSKGENIIALLYMSTSVLTGKSEEENNRAFSNFILKREHEKKNGKVSALL